MRRKWNGKKIFHICVLAIALVALGDFLLTRGNGEEGAAGKASVSWISILKEKAGQEILDVWLPAFAYADNGAGD